MVRKYVRVCAICLLAISAYAQEDEFDELFEDDPGYVESVFSSTRVINGHSTETLDKNELEFRIEHRFGDMLPGWDASNLAQSWLGFDQAADIRFGFEYGITDNIMVGIGRSKGSGAPYSSLLDGLVKYRILRQKEEGMPVSLTALGTVAFSYMKAVDDLSQVASFPDWQHRFGYCAQVNVSRKFGSWLSLSLSPTLVHRNYVAADDINTMFALGGAARVAVTKKMGVIVEYFHAFRDQPFNFFDRNNPNTYQNSLGIAFEFETFGHNFTINLTNSRGFGELQYIPYTFSDWMNGEFRLGFSIGRKFSF